MGQRKNLEQNREQIERIVDIIKGRGDELISIFGAGHWFLDEVCPGSDVDLIVLVQNTENNDEQSLLQEIDAAGLGQIQGFPVKVRLFWLEELEGRTFGKCAIAEDQRALRVFIHHFAFYTLLYGRPWPVSQRLLPSLELIEEFDYWRELILSPPHYTFLEANAPVTHYYTWEYFLKLYLFARNCMAALEDGYSYSYSFLQLEEFSLHKKDELLQRAFAYRRSVTAVPSWQRERLYRDVTAQLAACEGRLSKER